MKKNNKRFRKKGGKRGGQRDQRLLKAARALHGTDDEWGEHLDDRLSASTETAKSRAVHAVDTKDEPSWEADGPTFEGTVVSLASAIAWVERDRAVESTVAEITPGSHGDGSDEDGTDEDGIVQCALPTAIAQDQRSRVAVGDRVTYGRKGDDFLVLKVLPRRTWLARPDPLNPRLQRVVAANIDVVVQVASVVKPPLRPALLDRYLVAIQHGGALPVICINKLDLLSPAQQKRELAPLAPYRELGVPLIECSAAEGRGIDRLRDLLRGKTAAFVGHSGVGKSSLVNALSPATDAATGEVSESRGTGRHTTTRSSLYPLDDDIRLIDTPGIREFGLWNLNAESLAEYFPEFVDFAAACRFHNCSHSHEPSCAVREAAFGDGDVSAARYRTYLRILETL